MELDATLESRLAAAASDAMRVELLSHHAGHHARSGLIDDALETITRAEALARSLAGDRELGHALCVHANCEYLRADYPNAYRLSLDSAQIAARNDDKRGLAAALLIAAACQYQMGALEESHTALLQVLDIVSEHPDDEFLFRAHNMLGMILSSNAAHDDANERFRFAIAAAERMRSEFFLQRALVNRAGNLRKIGESLRLTGRENEALEHFREAARDCESVRAGAPGQSAENAAGCAGALGQIYLQLGRDAEAVALFEEMVKRGQGLHNAILQAEGLLLLGEHFTFRGDARRALQSLESALEMAKGAGARRLVVEACGALARWHETHGDRVEALERYKQFHRLSEELLRAELGSASRARTLWLDFQRLRRDKEALAMQATDLERAANEDTLTGLPNRRALDARLDTLVKRSREQGVRLVLAMLDVDCFKEINDRFSHIVGDGVLRAIARIIRVQGREADVSARLGGDEFVIGLVGATIDGAEATMQRLCRAVAGHDWAGLQPGLQVTVSIGIAQMAPEDDSIALVARADRAMYRAKKTGRNQVCVE